MQVQCLIRAQQKGARKYGKDGGKQAIQAQEALSDFFSIFFGEEKVPPYGFVPT